MNPIRLRAEDIERLGPGARAAVARALAEHTGAAVQLGDVAAVPAAAAGPPEAPEDETSETVEDEAPARPARPGRTLAAIGAGGAMVMALVVGGALGIVTTPRGHGPDVTQGGPAGPATSAAAEGGGASAGGSGTPGASASAPMIPSGGGGAARSHTATTGGGTSGRHNIPTATAAPMTSAPERGAAQDPTARPAAPAPTLAPEAAAETCSIPSGPAGTWTCLPAQVDIPAGPAGTCPPPLTGHLTELGNRIPLRVRISGPAGSAGLSTFVDTGGVHTTLPAQTLLDLGFVADGTEIATGMVPGSSETVQVFRVPGADLSVSDNGRRVPLATGMLTVLGGPAGSFETLGPDVLAHGVALSVSGGTWSLTPACT